MGVWFGENLLPPRPDNPKGYFEDIGLMFANEQLMTLLFGGWNSPVAWSDAEAFPLRHPRILEISESLRKVVSGLQTSGRPWAVKDPRLSRLLPIWWPMLRAMDLKPDIVMAVRRPSEVVASLEQRDHMGPATSRLLWLRHVAEPLAYALDHGLEIGIVSHDELIKSPELLLSVLRSYGWVLEPSQANFVDPGLRHHWHKTQPSNDALSGACESLYRAVTSLRAFSPKTVPTSLADMIRSAREMSVTPYLHELYLEAIGISSTSQRVLLERSKTQQRVRRHKLEQTLRDRNRTLARLQAGRSGPVGETN